jgi:hypothetical protein
MRRDVAEVRDPMQKKFIAGQKDVAARACNLFAEDPAKARAYLTSESGKACREAVESYWNLGDSLWTRYDEKW